ELLPREDVRTTDFPPALLTRFESIDAGGGEVGTVNRVDLPFRIEEVRPATLSHPEDLHHVGEVAGRIDHLARHRRLSQLFDERRLRLGEFRGAAVATNDVDEAERSDTVLFRGLEDRAIGAVVDVPRVGARKSTRL